MAKAAPTSWTLAEFLDWDDGTDTRYELVRGEVVAMATPSTNHGAVVMNLGIRIGSQLKPPCRIYSGVGIVPEGRDDTCYQADLAVSCTPVERGQRTLHDPVLVIEVLSPSTRGHDRDRKLDDYGALPSVREILLVWSEERRVQHWRREGDHWQVQNLIGDAVLTLAAVAEPIPLDAIYADSGVD